MGFSGPSYSEDLDDKKAACAARGAFQADKYSNPFNKSSAYQVRYSPDSEKIFISLR